MKKIALLFLFTLLIPQMVIANEPRPSINADVGELIYHIGGGKVIPRPGAGFRSFNIRARLRAGFSYSCGKFDFHNNIEQMINQIKDKVRQIPGQLQMAAGAAIAGLPGYLAMKYNPTLYNILTQNIDQTMELFNLSYKSCKQIEAEMRRDPTSNPYSNFMQASVLNKWSVGSSQPNANAADIHQEVKDEPAAPVPWFGTGTAGSAANPIRINRDFVIAGYNMMIGRTTDLTETDAPTGAMASEPVVKIWASPVIAGDWIQDVVGDHNMVLDETTTKQLKTGDGLRPIVEDLDEQIHAALLKAYEEDNYSDINEFTSLRVSGALIEGLHQLRFGQAVLMMDRLSSELAVNETQERVFLVMQMMRRAILSPDMAESAAGAPAIEYIRGTTFPMLEEMLSQIHDDLALKNSTVNKTTVSILNLAEKTRREAMGASPGSVRSERSFIGGGVETP